MYMCIYIYIHITHLWTLMDIYGATQQSLTPQDVPGPAWMAKTYCGWLRNPAPPKGWLKPELNSGTNHRFQLVQEFFHPLY